MARHEMFLFAHQLLTLPLLAVALSAGDLFHICHRSDPKLGECIRQSLQELLPTLLKGIPELKIVKYDPLFLPEVLFKQGNGAVSIDSTFSNQYVYGVSNMKFLSANADLDKNEVQFEFTVPYLYFEGNYSMDGRILLVPIKGQGYGRTNYTDVSGKAFLRGHPETRGGREFLVLDEIKFDMQVKNAKIELENLFNGDKRLGEALSRILQDNWALLLEELKPLAEESISVFVGDTVSRVFARFSLDELFPQ